MGSITKIVDPSTRLANLGLSGSGVQELVTEESEETPEEETEEPEEEAESDEGVDDALDALQATDEEEEETEEVVEEEETEEEPEADDEEEDSKYSQAIKQKEAAEKGMREWQSRYDRSQAEYQQLGENYKQLYSELITIKETASTEAFADVHDDDIVDVQTLKKMLTHYNQQNSAPQAPPVPHAQQANNQPEVQWVHSQDDWPDVQKYINDNSSELANDVTLPNSPQAVYFALKERMAKAELKQTRKNYEKKKEKMIRSKSRSKVPPTGGHASKKSGKAHVSDVIGQVEAQMRKLGINKSA